MIPTEAASFSRTAPASARNPTSRVVRMRLRWPRVNTIAAARPAAGAPAWRRRRHTVRRPGAGSRRPGSRPRTGSISAPARRSRRRQTFVGAVVVPARASTTVASTPGTARRAVSTAAGAAGVDQRQCTLRQRGEQRGKAVSLAEPLSSAEDRCVWCACRSRTTPSRRVDEQDELGAGHHRIGHEPPP